MRVAIVHYSKPPVIGGVERVIGEQAAALRELGHSVKVWDVNDWKALQPVTTARLKRSVDAIIVHNVFTMPFDLAWTGELTALAAASPDIRWINCVHDVRWCETIPQAVHVAVSEARKRDYAEAAKLPVSSISVIPNGVDFAKVLGLTPRVAKLDLHRAGLVMLQPARFVRRKNIELGLRVLKELPQAVYLITGAPDPHQQDGVAYFDELKVLASSLGVADRAFFLGEGGVLGDDDVRSLYQIADLLFFPSTQEGYGLPLLEAAMHELPVFCSDIPAHREVAIEATFFQLKSSPSGISRRIKANTEVRNRQTRRTWMCRFEWKRIAQEMLEPLLFQPRSS